MPELSSTGGGWGSLSALRLCGLSPVGRKRSQNLRSPVGELFHFPQEAFGASKEGVIVDSVAGVFL